MRYPLRSERIARHAGNIGRISHFLFISRTNEYLTHGFFRHGAAARQSLHSTAAWSCYASRRLIFTHLVMYEILKAGGF
ncbi:hypothetical protein, partial [Klebsiella pneumoniae]|uniref:hypothetical protein n=1 Tax=Klebsiella pneumoniae TaxID=573 RepID=UPI00210C962B